MLTTSARKTIILFFLFITWGGGMFPAFTFAQTLRLATTTSTENSGLLGDLIPAFTKATGITVQVIAVGTGKALRLGVSGDVDVVMVHDAKAELAWVKKGAFLNRVPLMYNQFLILAPKNGAGSPIGGKRAVAVFREIAQKGRVFVSRGDDSGTHRREKSLWKKAGVKPEKAWYKESGQGMGQTLVIASEMKGFTLSDEATFYAFRSRLALKPLPLKDPALKNPYSVMMVNSKNHPHIKQVGAMKFIQWLTGPEGQTRIEGFKANGKQLFFPLVIPGR